MSLVILSLLCVSISENKKGLVLGSHDRPVNAVAFSPDGRFLVSGGNDHKVVLWDLDKHIKKQLFEHSGPVVAAAFSPDGKIIGTGSDEEARFMTEFISIARLSNAFTGKQLALFKGEPFTNPACSVAFSPDGKSLAVGCMRGFETKTNKVKIWDVASKKLKLELEGDFGHVYCLAYSPDGVNLITVGIPRGQDIPQGEVIIWDLERQKPRSFTKVPIRINSVVFHRSGETYAIGGGDIPENTTELRIIDVKNDRHIRRFHGQKYAIRSVAFSADGRYLASAGGNPYDKIGELILWDVSTGKQVTGLTGNEDLINSVAFSPDGKWLASGGSDKSVRIWDLTKLIPSDK